MTIFKILGIFANHTNNKIKYNISLNNYSKLKNNLDAIIIVDTLGEKYAEKLQLDLLKDEKLKNYYLINNDNFFDFGKWIYALKNINYSMYDYILFINDSIIILDQLEKFFIKLKEFEYNINFYGYNDSNQINYHYQTYLFFINVSIVNKFINFFENKKQYIFNLDTLIENIELKICEIDDAHDCYIKLANDLNNFKNIFWENEDLYQLLVSKNIFTIMKLKKISHLQDLYKIKIYSSSFDNFDYDFYKNYYDLNELSDEELFKHFIETGQYEGRKPHAHFKTILPQCYQDKLYECNLLYFFDIPKDFDIYYYKYNNPGLEKLSNLDAINHYIDVGVYESRVYNKTSTGNIYLNNFYLSLINKLNYINEVLPEDFIIYYYEKYNKKILKTSWYYGYIYHYIKFGKRKNLYYKKILNDNFNIIEYKNNNKNLENLSDDELMEIYIDYENKKNSYNIIDFNPLIYKKIYNDIKNLSDNEAIDHYINNGINDNRIYKIPNDFDHLFYKSIYDDLKDYTNKDLEEHYLYNGIKQNRIYKFPENFDYNSYRLINDELSNLTDEELKNNYIEYGIKNKINFVLPHDFDHNIYKKIYNDLANLTNKELENHYLYYGIFEKRIYKFPDDFDYKIYKKIYKDLINYDDDSLKIHYLENGIYEKRIYKIPEDFNCNMYKNIYKDLYKLNDFELKNHYIEYGVKEGRIYKIPDDFNHELYKNLYKHLENYDNTELENDYLLIGINEKRIYKMPIDFDYDFYRLKYDDIKLLSNDEINMHYLTFGFFEKRIYKFPIDFDNIIYKSLYSDLNNLNEYELKLHYIKFGMDEGRIYKFPDDFDYYKYKNIYKDLNKLSNEDLKKHYIENGFKEGRIYNLPDDFNCETFKLIYPFLIDYSDEELKDYYLYSCASLNKIYKMPKIDKKTCENILNKFI